MLWSAICFKIMPRYTCVFLSRILAFFPALWGFYSQVYDHFLTNAHIYAHKKSPHIYALQTSMCIGVTESRRIRGTELYRQQKTPSCTIELKSNFQFHFQFSRRCFASTGISFTHSFFFYYYFMSDFSDYPSQTISPCPPPLPLNYLCIVTR